MSISRLYLELSVESTMAQIQHPFRKGGIPALAWPVNASYTCACSLAIKVNEAYGQAAIVLHFDIPNRDFEKNQRISLLYNADNWVPGQIKRGQLAITPWYIKELTRGQRRCDSIDSLSMVLRQPCTVLCPPNIAPKDGSGYLFQQLVDLAKATKVSIVFVRLRLQ